MNISYKEFEDEYLYQAEVLARDQGNPGIAPQLCKIVYEGLDGQKPCSSRDIFVKLAEVFYSQFYAEKMHEELLLVERIFNRLSQSLKNNLAPFPEILSRLEPVLYEIPLIDRVVTALNALGWENSVVADLLNNTLTMMSHEINDAKTLSEVEKILEKIRNGLVSRIESDANDKWLVKLFLHKDPPLLEMKTWQMIYELSHVSTETRFARNNNPYRDKFGKLRDKWDYGKRLIRKKLKPEHFCRAIGSKDIKK